MIPMTNPLFFDLLFAAILLGMYAYGKRRGAFRVIAGLFGTIAAWIGTLILRPMVLPMVVGILNPWATRAVTSAAEAAGLLPIFEATCELSAGAGQAAAAMASLSDKLAALGLPEQMTALAQSLGITASLQGLLDTVSGIVSPLQLLAEAMVAKIAPGLTFFLLFIGLKLALAVAVQVLSLDWPILRGLNRMAGGLIGLAGGAVLVLVVCAGIFRYGSPEPTGLTSQPLLLQSYVGGFLASLFA